MFGSEGVMNDPHPLGPRPHLLLLGDPGTGKSQLLQVGGTRHGENRLTPWKCNKQSPLLKSDRIPFKEAGESIEKPSIFQGRCLLNFRDVFLLMDVVVVIVCVCCMKHVFIPVKICFFIHWSLRFFMGLRYCCCITWTLYRQGLTGNLYPHLLSFPLSKLAIFVGQMPMSITNNSWRWLMTSNPTPQGLPSKPWTFHGDFFVDPCNSWWNLCPYQLPHRRQHKSWVAVAFAPVA